MLVRLVFFFKCYEGCERIVGIDGFFFFRWMCLEVFGFVLVWFVILFVIGFVLVMVFRCFVIVMGFLVLVVMVLLMCVVVVISGESIKYVDFWFCRCFCFGWCCSFCWCFICCWCWGVFGCCFSICFRFYFWMFVVFGVIVEIFY